MRLALATKDIIVSCVMSTVPIMVNCNPVNISLSFVLGKAVFFGAAIIGKVHKLSVDFLVLWHTRVQTEQTPV